MSDLNVIIISLRRAADRGLIDGDWELDEAGTLTCSVNAGAQSFTFEPSEVPSFIVGMWVGEGT